MAAIQIHKNKSWVVAGWVFRYLADKATSRLGKNSPLRTAFEAAVKSNLCWLSIEELEKDEQRQFARLAAEVYEELKKTDPKQFSTIQGYEGLKAQIGELVEMTKHLKTGA